MALSYAPPPNSPSSPLPRTCPLGTRFPPLIKDGTPHTFAVRFSDTSTDLTGSPRSVTCGTPPLPGSWADAAGMPTARRSFVAGVIGGRIYAAGGDSNNGGRGVAAVPLSTLEAYDPATNAWAALAQMPRPDFVPTAVPPVIYVPGDNAPSAERVSALSVVVGRTGWRQLLAENKDAFALEFVMRGRFADAYPSGMSPADFVSKLNANTGGALSAAEADALAAELTAAGNDARARAAALRRVAENAEFSRRELNRAFVLSQYFGYLRRNPNEGADTDFSGYRFWLSKLEEFRGDYHAAEMVRAFLSSAEYRQRFGR